MTSQSSGTNARLQIKVDRWSSDADRDALAIADQENGIAAVARLLHDGERIGFVRTAGRIGNTITFARDVRHRDGTHRVLIVLSRILSAREIQRSTPTADYPFTVIELHLDAGGSGEGTMTVGAKVRFHRGDDQIEMEKYSGGAILLRDVKTAPEEQ
jgi:hypothetical protein